MNTSADFSRAQSPVSFLDKALAVALGGLATATAFLLLFSFALTLLFSGKLLPGVSVAGVDLGGLNRQEAEALLREKITYPNTGLIALEYNGQVWTFSPAELGLTLDYTNSIEQAYQFGRNGWPWLRPMSCLGR